MTSTNLHGQCFEKFLEPEAVATLGLGPVKFSCRKEESYLEALLT